MKYALYYSRRDRNAEVYDVEVCDNIIFSGDSYNFVDSTEGSTNLSESIVSKQNQIPDHFEVRQNYPNPFNATTTIEYDMIEEARVYVFVYNIFGHRIKTITNELNGPGTHRLEWDGTSSNGHEVASGVYFYVLVADENYSMGKMILLK